MQSSFITSFWFHQHYLTKNHLASLDKRFGKVPLQRKLTRYVLDFSNIEKLIFEIIPSIS
jgi:hypothetical protein